MRDFTDDELAYLAGLEAAEKLTPDQVLADAVDPDHPCHDRFTWDDSEAADRWRRQEAAIVIGSVRILIESQDDTEVSVRAYTRVPSQGRSVASDVAAQNYRAELAKILARDARHLVAKHRRLGVDTIRQVVEEALGG